MKFELTKEQSKRLEEWIKEVKPKVLKKVGGDILQPNEPYFGAIGGGISYTFEPNGVGMGVTVKYGDEEIDLTEYDKW